jgi:hypothetical protein
MSGTSGLTAGRGCEGLFGGSEPPCWRLTISARIRPLRLPCSVSRTAEHFRILPEQSVLYERLSRLGVDLPRTPRPSPLAIRRRLDSLFPEGFETIIGAGVVRGVRVHRGREVTITGIVQGAPLTAVAAWMLAESVITSVRARPDRPIVILYDSPGHAATHLDESLLFEYLAHLAQTIQWAGQHCG